MHVYQMRSSNQSIVSLTQQRTIICMNALSNVSKVWLVAKMVHTLFESILGNKALEEKLQRAPGRRHKNKPNGHSASRTSITTPLESAEPQKRKFDDMELGYTNGPPAPQMSYERSRPQSPAITPSRELPPQSQPQHAMPALSAASQAPPLKANDAFMGASRSNTRPTTPFNNFSYPGTPPDLFLHTRNSPKISDDLWQNYQPDQLFPPEANGMFPLLSPNQSMVDPALRAQTQQAQQFVPNMQQPQSMPLQQQQQQQTMPSMSYPNDPSSWSAQMQALGGASTQQQRPDDQWSTASSNGPIVPTTLNVGDWFEFFGIPNGSSLDALNGGGYG